MTFGDLTPREQEIVALLVQGFAYDDIAAALPSLRSRTFRVISVETVKKHIERIAAKIDGDDEITPRRRIVRWYHGRAA